MGGICAGENTQAGKIVELQSRESHMPRILITADSDDSGGVSVKRSESE